MCWIVQDPVSCFFDVLLIFLTTFKEKTLEDLNKLLMFFVDSHGVSPCVLGMSVNHKKKRAEALILCPSFDHQLTHEVDHL